LPALNTNTTFSKPFLLRSIVSDKISFRKPFTEEVPQEVDNDRNET
jgi:hypothetical protein